MAYGLKYELECLNRDNEHYVARISIDGYSGSEIERNVPANPFRLLKEKAKKRGVICGTSFEFGIREAVDFEFLEFYTNDPQKIKVELYKNLIQGFENYFGFETFLSSGRRIVAAINSSGGVAAVRGLSSFEIKQGESVRIKFNLTVNGGYLPDIFLIDHDWSNYVHIGAAAGLNDVVLTPTWSGTTYMVLYDWQESSDFATDEIKVLKCIWSGFLNPQQYKAPYRSAPVTLFFQATDGLGLLKNADYTQTGRNSELAIIKHCLDKTGLSLDFSVAAGIHEVSHNASYSPLAQTYHDSVIFSGLNCYEVIERLLERYEATITQWENRWVIVSYKDKKGTRLLYSNALSFIAEEEAPAVLELGIPGEDGTDVHPAGVLDHEFEAGGRSINVKYDYGRKESLLDYWDFNPYSGSLTDYWTQNGEFTIEQRRRSDGVFYIFMEGTINHFNDYIEQVKNLENVSDECFVFEIKAAVCGGVSDSGQLFGYKQLQVNILVALTVGSTNYFLTLNGWQTTPGYISSTLNSGGEEPDFTSIKIVTVGLPGSGTLTVRLCRAMPTTYPVISTLRAGVFYTDVKAYFVKNNEKYTPSFEDKAIFEASKEPGTLDDIEIISADAPEVKNRGLIYQNIARLQDGTPTSLWKIDGYEAELSLVDLLMKLLASSNRLPKQRLEGVIKGAGIGFINLIRHAYNNNREFEISEAAWEIYDDKWKVVLLEWLPFANQEVLYEKSERRVVSITDPPVITLNSIGTINDGTEYNPLNIGINATNSGGDGQRTVYWQIRDSGGEVINSGNKLINFEEGTDDYLIETTYPASANGYKAYAGLSPDDMTVESNAFNSEATGAPSITLTSIDTVPDGTQNEPGVLYFNAVNSGSAGQLCVFWGLYNGINVKIDSGYADIDFATGSGKYSIDFTYPEANPGYYFKIGREEYTMELTSNTFTTSSWR